MVLTTTYFARRCDCVVIKDKNKQLKTHNNTIRLIGFLRENKTCNTKVTFLTAIIIDVK